MRYYDIENLKDSIEERLKDNLFEKSKKSSFVYFGNIRNVSTYTGSIAAHTRQSMLE